MYATLSPRWRSELRLPVFVGAIVAGGLGCVLLAALAVGGSAVPPLWRIALAFAVVAVSDYGVLHLRFGRETCTLTWSEAAVLVGLELTPWPWVVLVGAGGVLASQLASRRALLKSAFNVGSMAAGTTLAAACVRLIAGSADLTDVSEVRRLAALAAATALYFVWNTASVACVIALAGGRSLADVWREGLALKIGILAGNTVIALLLVSVPWRGSTSVLIPFCMILLYLTYRAYHRATEDSDVWRQLDAAAKELTLLDEADVAAASVARAVTLFNAEFAELVLPVSADGLSWTFRCDADGRVLRHSGDDDGGQPPLPTEGTVETPLSVAADGASTAIGTLRVGLGAAARPPERQLRVLRTYAHSVATSLQNARLYAEMRLQAEVNAYEANHDPLTGLLNRKVLNTELEHAIAIAQDRGRCVGLLLIDLDHFKDINDTLGHHAGDAVLRSLADRLTATVTRVGMVARLGGDEFAILLPDLPSPEAAEMVAANLLVVVEEPIDYEGLHLAVGGSIGFACSPHDGRTSEDLLRLADTALYQAKGARRTVSRYRSDRDDNSLSRITLAADLRGAIAGGQIVLHYQPQVDLETGAVVGAEALARWLHPQHGLIAPADFIDIVERTGLAHEFALAVMDQAIGDATRWNREGSAVPVSVNLSARNLLDPRLPDTVARILARHGLPPQRLVIELTETTMITDAVQLGAVMAHLRRLGVQLSVDDFGTGYSSLAFLQRVAVNEIKVDRSFVMAMLGSDSDAVIVRATIELAHGLGIRVVAEGVETLQHVTMLRTLGCDVAQGWHFGKPAPVEHLTEAWLHASRRPRSSRPAPVRTRCPSAPRATEPPRTEGSERARQRSSASTASTTSGTACSTAGLSPTPKPRSAASTA